MADSAPASLYVYVDTALGALNRRNHVKPLNEVDFKDAGAERYITHRRATAALVDWTRTHTNASGNPTIEGFDGEVWDSSLPFDFDDRVDPANALGWVRQFLERLQHAEVPLDALRIYFSGFKGFHLEIPHTLFGGFMPSDSLHVSEKAAALELMAGIPFDTAVYDKLRLWRLPNTLNAKGHRYKVRLSLDEVLGLSMEEIKVLADTPRPRLLPTAPDDEWSANAYLVEVWARATGNMPVTGSVEPVSRLWSDTRRDAVFDAAIAAAIAASWPSDAGVSRHSDYLLPLSGFLSRQMDAAAVAELLKEAAQRAGDVSFLNDRQRHWQDEIDRLAQGSATKIAAGQPCEGLPTVARRWPELADFLGASYVSRARSEYTHTTDMPDEDQEHLAVVPDFPLHVLPKTMRDTVDLAVVCGLPANLACGAVLAAVAAAAGGEVEVVGTWVERLIVWVAMLAPRGAGKSPVQSLAFGAIREHDAEAFERYHLDLAAWQTLSKADKLSVARPSDPRLRIADANFESVVRRLNATNGAAVWDLDELSQLLRGGLGEYKHGPGADQARLLQLWSGVPWPYERVGAGGKDTNGVDILIGRPTLVICGGLQTRLHARLGGEEDGLRPRWLLHLSNLPELDLDSEGDVVTPPVWDELQAKLLSRRRARREWALSPDARRAFLSYRRAWKQASRSVGENASVSAALIKADIQVMRVAGTFMEATLPGEGGRLDVGMLDRAAEYVDATIDCWRALTEQARLSLSLKDERLDEGVEALVDWLEQRHTRQATPRELQRSHVAGVRSSGDLDALLGRYDATFPGCIETAGYTGGRRGRVVKAPQRSPTPQRLYGKSSLNVVLKESGDNGDKSLDGPVGAVEAMSPGDDLSNIHISSASQVENEIGHPEPKNPGDNGFVARAEATKGEAEELSPLCGDMTATEAGDNACQVCGAPLSATEIAHAWRVHWQCRLSSNST